MKQNILIPEQQVGSQMDVRSTRRFIDIGEAVVFYQIAKLRLYDVNHWREMCGSNATNFQLIQPDGLENSDLKEGNLIRIDIPGPSSTIGEGFDWVRIEKIMNSSESEIDEWTGFTVRPCANPAHPDSGVAHFFTNLATSSFILGRTGNTVWAEVCGRNELPNDCTEKIVDKLRNSAVGIIAKIGFSYPQWKFLADGLMKEERN